MTPQRFSKLLAQWRQDSMNATDAEEFLRAARSGHYDELLNDAIETDLDAESFKRLSKEDEKAEMLQLIRKQYAPPARVRFINRPLFKYAAAILVIATVIVFLLNRPSPEAKEQPVAMKQVDVAPPGAVLATITLEDGTQINLETAAAGVLASQGNVTITKTGDGKISYSSGDQDELMYNTITVPRGSKATNIVLSDGSKVWLNAGSSLRYPVVFARNERKVEINGEGYFEITKDAKRKFLVSDGNSITEVLGTSFNVNSYDDENVTTTTLLEGAVKVSAAGNEFILEPGEQSVNDRNGKLSVNDNINTEEVIAWKNGLFMYESADFGTIARQASRWYNVEFIFENKKAETEIFHGTFSRNAPLTELLKILELSDVKFKIDGDKVIIK